MKSILFITCFLIQTIFLSMPLLTSAANIPWISESYRVDTYAYVSKFIGGTDSSTDYAIGPPLPLSSNAYASAGWGKVSSAYASSTMSSSEMNVFTDAVTALGEYEDYSQAKAQAEFTGEFIALLPEFMFSYNKEGSLYDPYSILSINDLTEGTSTQFNLSRTGEISVPVVVGNRIEVQLSVETRSYTCCDIPGVHDDREINLDYSMAVAPEPISSTLFITGSILLVGRGFIKRRKSA